MSPTTRTSSLISLFLLAILIGTTATFVKAIVWSDSEIRLTTYDDFDGMSALVQTTNGEIWIVWTRYVAGNYNVFYMISPDHGNTWSPETPLTAASGANTGVSVFQTSDGTIWVAWTSERTGDYEAFYKTSPDLGASWSNDTQLTFEPGYDLQPDIYQLSNGTIWVVWASSRTGDHDLYLKTSSDGGNSWSGDIRLTADPSFEKSPSVLQASDGTIWVVWSSDKAGNGDIYYMVYNGSSWLDETQLTSSPPIDTNPCILQTLDGKIWMFWSRRSQKDAADATDDIYYKYSSDNGVTWSVDTQFTTDPYDDMWPSAIQTHDVKIWVLWTSDRYDQPDWGNWDLYYRTSLVGDVTDDGAIDIFDLTLVALSYGRREGDPKYNPGADINVDGIVDARDLAFVSMNFGAT